MSSSSTEYYVSAKWATGLVVVNNEIIIETCPIWYKFKGQPFSNLLKWLKNTGEVIVYEYPSRS